MGHFPAEDDTRNANSAVERVQVSLGSQARGFPSKVHLEAQAESSLRRNCSLVVRAW